MKYLLCLAFAAGPAAAEPTPQGPVVALSRDRAEIVLNGIWRFQPADATSAKEPIPAEWGEFPTPGNWIGDWRIRLPREPVKRGAGDAWKKFGAPTTAGWYERAITVPADWANRKTLLQVGRVSTDALVWVDGKPAGVLGYLGGELDLTHLIQPGKESILRFFVAASKPVLKDFSFTNSPIPASDGGSSSKGITGDVVLIARPSGPRVDHVAVLPSVRNKELTLRIELADAAPLSGKELNLTAEAFEAQSSKLAKQFSAKATADVAGVIRATFPWPDAHLWDTHDPFLHRLTLTIKGAGIDDQFSVPQFGFREFWAEGRDLFLNGSLIRLRPAEASPASHVASIHGDFRRRLEQGHNILEVWPQDTRERGFTHSWALYANEASKAGMLIMMPTVKLNEFFSRGEEKFREWIDLTRRDWRSYVNQPSVVIMVPTGNMQALAADMNPRWLGRSDTPPMHEYQVRDWEKMDQANAILRNIDPTRLIMHHQGGPRSDIVASNTYLNWVPLQEREEWLRDWADRSIDKVTPFSAIEFGTPLDCSFFRNRNGYGNAYQSEAQMTEFAAIYLGPAAYEMETAAYRQEVIAKDYVGKDPATGAARWLQRQNPAAMVTAPAFQEIQRLFQRNTMRSWRTWGLSGGAVPWNDGFTHQISNRDEVPGVFIPGDRGSFYSRVRKLEVATSFHDPAYKELPVAKVLQSSQQPGLAWIAGKTSDWTEKGHHFKAAEKIEKSVVLINDGRREEAYQGRWELRRGDAVLSSGDFEGQLAIGEIKHLPIAVTAPAETSKTAVEIHLTASLGEQKFADNFPLVVWPESSSPDISAATLYDPVGKTSAMLGRQADALTAKPGKLSIIGREALSSGKFPVEQLASMEKHVSDGNTLLIMTQDPEWIRRWWGFRTCRQIVRRAWPVNSGHPLWEGIGAEDLRDWRSAGTLVESRPQYDHRLPPRLMYRWGNQGSVSSAAVEKPHLSGWTPLLQCEFDLQYSPLMEVRRGKGRVILCLLDLEDQAPADPAANAMMQRLMQYAMDPLPARSELDGIAPNDLPVRIAVEPTLQKPLDAVHANRPAGVSLRELITPLQPLHQLAETKPWLRLPRWRLTRVEHQLRVNAGDEFPADARIFHPRCDLLDLSGLWLFRPISRQNAPPGKPLPDSGMNDYHRSLGKPDFDQRLFVEVWLPEALMEDTDADAIARRNIQIPRHWEGKKLVLDLGVLQSSAVILYDGITVSGDKPIEAGSPVRCEIPAEHVKEGRATIAIRLWNGAGPGGFADPARTRLSIGLDGAAPPLPIYHADYRADFRDGDEPYRFFRW